MYHGSLSIKTNQIFFQRLTFMQFMARKTEGDRSFIKRQTSGTSNDNEWYNE